MSRNEKFWVDQVTVPHPPPGNDKGWGTTRGGGGVLMDSHCPLPLAVRQCIAHFHYPRSLLRSHVLKDSIALAPINVAVC